MPHNSRRAPIEVSASDQVISRPTYSSGLGATSLLPGGFCHSRRSDFPEDKADVRTREKSYLRPAGFSSTPPPSGTWG